MKRTALFAAIAAAAAPAMAWAPADFNTADLTLRISGATAADNQIENYIAQVCDPATLDRYDNPDDSGAAFFCTVPNGAVPGISGAKRVIFYKNSFGSSAGVEPVTTGTNTEFLNIQSGCSLVGTQQWSCSNTLVSAPAEVGISDVEPELFAIPDNGNKTVDLTAPLSVNSVNIQTFGIVVTPELRDALQAAQGLTVGSDEVSQMPTLSSDIVANVLAGNIASWNTLKDGNGIGIVDAYNAVNSANFRPEVNLCVRTPGSGTQAQANAFYQRNACSYRGAGDGGFLGFFTADDSDNIEDNTVIPELFPGFPLSAPWVFENGGSSDMGRCLTQIGQDNRFAIGIQSLEKVDEGRTNRNRFKYVAIDGVAPTLENVAASLYKNWAAASIQWRTDVVTGDKADLAVELVRTAQDVAAVSVFNQSLQDDDPATTDDDRPVGGFRTPEILDGGSPADVGSLAFQSGALTASIPFNPANPVAPINKGLSSPSSCKNTNIVGDIDVSVR